MTKAFVVTAFVLVSYKTKPCHRVPVTLSQNILKANSISIDKRSRVNKVFKTIIELKSLIPASFKFVPIMASLNFSCVSHVLYLDTICKHDLTFLVLKVI